jgi:hypothetical protein
MLEAQGCFGLVHTADPPAPGWGCGKQLPEKAWPLHAETQPEESRWRFPLMDSRKPKNC